MKKSLHVLIASVFASATAFAQTWCTPTVTPYAGCPSMPGISNVTFNTINFNSPTCQSPSSNYINTGQSTTVTKGQSYSFSMTFNTDPSIDPQMNLRVWIDFNIDGQLDDPGETVLSANSQNPGTYTGTILIPMTATAGTTRMRVTSKMTSTGGHTLPTPCNVPADPLGYHGGVEDYTLIIVNPAGVEETISDIIAMSVSPNPADDNAVLSYSLKNESTVNVEIFSVTGQKTVSVINETQAAGAHSAAISASELESGIYFIKLSAGDFVTTKKLIVTKH